MDPVQASDNSKVFRSSNMITQQTTKNRNKRQIHSLFPQNEANSSAKRRRTDANGTNGSLKRRESLNIVFRNIKFTVPIYDGMTAAKFKKRFKLYASKMMNDFNADDYGDEHFSIRYGLLQETLTDSGLKYLQQGYDTTTVRVQDAIGLRLNVPGNETEYGLFVFPSDDTRSFKSKIMKKLNMKNDSFRVYTKVCNDLVRSASVLKSGDQLVVRKTLVTRRTISKRKGTEQIFVKTLTGKTMTFDIQNNQTVLRLKDAIQERDGIPPEEQSLIFRGRRLKDGQKLNAYGIKERSTIHLVMRMPGS